MKKTFLAMTALSAMLFAGCTSSDELTTLESITKANEAPTAVEFGTYMGKTGTRTTNGSTGDIVQPSAGSGNKLGTTGYEFGVFAYLTDGGVSGATLLDNTNITAKPNFMYNEKISSSDNGATWTYAPIKYWPNGIDLKNYGASDPSNTATQATVQYLSFFAYAPYVSTFGEDDGLTAITPANTGTGAPVITYKLASNAKANDAVDLLWGLRNSTAGSYTETDNDPSTYVANSYNINLTKQTTGEKVAFLFKHALAKLGGASGLKVQLDVDNNSNGALDNNSCVTIKQITIQNVLNAVATQGDFNIATGTWSASKASIAKAGAINLTLDEDDIADALYCATSPTKSGSWSKTGVTNSAVNVYKTTESPFYMIPSVADQQLEISIQYTVTTADNKLDGGYSVVNQTITNIVTLPSLLVNHYYTIIMHLGLTSVKFEADVQAWDSDGSGEETKVWLPSNVVD